MELLVKVSATQLSKNDKTFLGAEVKGKDNDAFAVINIAGAATRVGEGMWVIEFLDGTQEVWSNEQVYENTGHGKSEPEEESEALVKKSKKP